MGEEYGLNMHAIAKNSPPLPRRASSRVTRWRKITRSFLILIPLIRSIQRRRATLCHLLD